MESWVLMIRYYLKVSKRASKDPHTASVLLGKLTCGKKNRTKTKLTNKHHQPRLKTPADKKALAH